MSLVSEGVEVRSPLVAGVGEPSLATVGDYVALMKPRVMSLVVFTALVGLAVAPGSLHPVAAFTALLCIAVGAGAAGALNMWYDADVDALMTRTARRPVPMGRVRPGEALAFGLTLGSFAVVTLGLLGGIGTPRFHHLLLCRDLHDVAQAFDAAEHRHRRRRRSVPANDRLGRGHRLAKLRAGLVVPDHLLLDAAAFLGARALSHRRVRAGAYPDAARGFGRCQHAASDHVLHADPCAARRCTLGSRLYRRTVWRHGHRDGRHHGGARLAGFP